MKLEVNDTLNQILIKVASGINYASDLAKTTGKSIPVIFRQLDELMKKGILSKTRNGKKVEYIIKWNSLADSLSSFVKTEFDLAKINLTKIKIPTYPLKEIQKIMESVFETLYLQEIFKEMHKEIEYAGKVSIEYTKTKFNDSMNILLDTFGSLTEKEKKDILEKIPEKQKSNFFKFIKISKIHKEIKNEIDPRTTLKKKL
jgi:hypothetical protein